MADDGTSAPRVERLGHGLQLVSAVAQVFAEATPDFLCRGAHAGRPASDVVQVVLLDLKLPKVDGLTCCARCAPIRGPG